MKALDELIDIIEEHLINFTEDAHFDFKEKWHRDFDNLLKDIISMANSPDELDSYIVVGVTNDFKVVGFNDNDLRRTKSDISSGIRDYQFGGNSVPEIDLISIPFDGKELDVLEIKNSNSLPFYLTQKRNKILPYAIYTRANDSNKEATFEECELLWKKRFNILLTEEERFRRLLENPNDWTEYDKEYFYKYDASFRIRKTDFDERDNPPFYAYIVDDWGRFETRNVILSHNGNEIASFQLVYLDGCRLEFVTPEYFLISLYEKGILGKSIYYRGYIKDTLRIALTNFFYIKNFHNADIEYQSHFEQLRNSFVVYESDKARKNFENFIRNNYDDFKSKLKELNPIIYSSTPEKYKEDIKTGILLHNLHEQNELWNQS